MGKSKPRRSGERRSHLKRFSSAMINSGGDKRNATVVAEYAERVKSLRIGPWLHEGPDSAPRQESLNRMNETMEGTDKERIVHLINRKDPQGNLLVRVRMFHVISNKMCFLIKEDFRTREFKKSIPYGDPEVAKRRLNSHMVMWEQEFTVPRS